MKRLLTAFFMLLFVVACERDVEFACRVVECEATAITTNGATLEATVNALDYAAIERMVKPAFVELNKKAFSTSYNM